MGFGQNLLIFVAIGALLISLIPGNSFTSTGSVASFIGINLNTSQPTQTGLLQIAFNPLVLGTVALAIGTIFYPNPFTLFATLAGLLLTLGSIYFSMFKDMQMPFEFQLVIGGFVALAFLLTTIGFLKGGEW